MALRGNTVIVPSHYIKPRPVGQERQQLKILMIKMSAVFTGGMLVFRFLFYIKGFELLVKGGGQLCHKAILFYLIFRLAQF